MRSRPALGVLFVAVLLSAGCESEIDKCVKAAMRAWDAEYPNGLAHIESKYGTTDTTRVQHELKARMLCLEAAAPRRSD